MPMKYRAKIINSRLDETDLGNLNQEQLISRLTDTQFWDELILDQESQNSISSEVYPDPRIEIDVSGVKKILIPLSGQRFFIEGESNQAVNLEQVRVFLFE